VIRETNLIVATALPVVRELLLQGTGFVNPLYHRLHSIYVGRGTTGAATTDTWLEYPLDAVEIADADKTSESDHLKVQVLLPAITAANGYTLTEAALATRGSVPLPVLPGPGDQVSMFSRAIHPGVPKTPAITVLYTWRIYLTL